MLGITVALHRAVLTALDIFPFRRIVDIVVVICDLFLDSVHFCD